MPISKVHTAEHWESIEGHNTWTNKTFPIFLLTNQA